VPGRERIPYAAAELAAVDGKVPDIESHIDRIYRAAVAPEAWPEFLEPLREELRGGTIHVMLRHPRDGARGVDAALGVEEEFANAFHTYYYKTTPWRPYTAVEREGAVRALGSYLPEVELVKTEFYNDWLRPQGLLDGFVAILRKDTSGGLVSSFGSFREKGQGPFENQDLDWIRPLVPHLQRALVIHSRVQGAEIRAGAAAEAMDRISGGVILFDERGDAILTNRAADRILAMGDGLVLERDGPSASTSKQTGELRRLLRDAATTGAGEGTDPGGVMWLARPSGHLPLEVVVTPISRESPLLCDRVTAAILITDPDAAAERPPERLRRIYTLTVTEAEVASRLARGMRLSEICEDLGVSLHTVRGHLKQLFAKTRTHRQADLIRVILTGPARLHLE
jgi:DNA-binding CsgD family transcriptional regulator